MTCGNGTKFRTRECTEDCKNESIEIQYKDCEMGCCPGTYMKSCSLQHSIITLLQL